MEVRDKLKLRSNPAPPPKNYSLMNSSNNNNFQNYEQIHIDQKSNGGGKNFNRKISIKYTNKDLNTEQNNIITLLVSKKKFYNQKILFKKNFIATKRNRRNNKNI